MDKTQLLYNIQQDMAMEQMRDNIATIAKDVSDLNLDMVTVRDELAELKKLVRDWVEKRKKSEKTEKK